MVNIDTRLLKVADANEVFWLLCIANRMGKDLTCFPSLSTQMEDTGWGKPKVISVRESCEKKGFISVKKRFDAKKNCQTSNIYKIKTPFLSVFVNLKEKGDNELGSNENIQGGSMKKVEKVVTKSYRGSNENIQGLYENVTLSINQSNLLTNEVLEKEEKTKKVFSPSPTFSEKEINNAFVSTLDVSTIQYQKEKSSAQKEKGNTEWFARQSELESKLAALDFTEITTPQTAVPFQNANGKKIYQTPDEMAQDLKLYWQGSPSHKDALNFVLSELGITTDAQKIAWAKFMKAKVYPSILTSKTYKDELMDVIELHKVVVYKYLTFDEIKEQIKALKVAQVTKKIETPQAKQDIKITDAQKQQIATICAERLKVANEYEYYLTKEATDSHKRLFDNVCQYVLGSTVKS
jgi:hypothetical protein